MDKLRPQRQNKNTYFVSFGNFARSMVLAGALLGCGPDTTPVTHPTPSMVEVAWPQDAVLLTNQPNQRIKSGTVELYQNTPSDFPHHPFEVYVSPSAFEDFIKSLETEKVVVGEQVRFVYHFPGDPGGSELICQKGQGNIVTMELAREIYEKVYVPNYNGKNLIDLELSKRFIAQAQNQANLVLFHEAQHIRHCREGLDKVKAEQDAIAAETRRAAALKPVLLLKQKPGSNLNSAIEYIKGLRK